MKIDVTGDAGFSGLEAVKLRLSEVPGLMTLAEGVLRDNRDEGRPDHYRSAVERLHMVTYIAGAMATFAHQLDVQETPGGVDMTVRLSELTQMADMRWLAILRQQTTGTIFDGGGWMAHRAIEGAVLAQMAS